VSQSSSFDHCHCQALITVTVTRHHLESGRPPSTTHFGSAGPPSHNLMAIDRDLVADSSGVSVVVTKEPAQPLATLHSTGTTNLRPVVHFNLPTFSSGVPQCLFTSHRSPLHHQHREVSPNEFCPCDRSSALRRWRYTMAPQNIADRLIGDMISQIGECPDNPVIAPGSIFLGHPERSVPSISLPIGGLPWVRRAHDPSNLRATSLRYHPKMVPGRAAVATSPRALRPSRWPISARVIRSASESLRRPCN